MEIRKVGVVGAGFMGAGIAQVAAQAGYDVCLVDVREEALPRARRGIESSLARLHAKGQISDPPAVVLDRVRTGLALDQLADADWVFEAVFETLPEKHALLTGLESICRPDTIFASNTSAIPIGQLAHALKSKSRLIGTHFFSPVPVNPLLEIIPGPLTAPYVFSLAEQVGLRLGKHVVTVKKDVPGFIMNRLFGAMACEAMRLVEEGVGTIEDIDRGMTTGYGMHMGPLAIADFAGLDVCLHAFTNIHTMGAGALAAPPEILRRLVREGKHGRKAGEGFYKYTPDGKTLGPAM
jgi:3-hydroxybutyryl-CoA dehydrogenase